VGSDLPITTTVGRFCSLAEGIKVLGYRHPIEAVSQSSAVFNFEREFVSAYRTDRMQLGKFVHTPVPVKTPQPEQKISIGHDVWIGSNVTLSPGICIGNGAVVAANSLVLKDVPAYTIVGGSPAKFIRLRFDDVLTRGLEESRWWDFELSDMFDLGLNFDDPLLFLSQFKQLQGQLNLAHYAKTSGLMLSMKENIPVYESTYGTVLRVSDNTISHDVGFSNPAGLSVSPTDLYSDLQMERHADATVSWKRDGCYLSAAPDGKILWVKRNGKQERFFHHANFLF
jgi:acetyltransferase-like isoleucine patch superfamily enzyme